MTCHLVFLLTKNIFDLYCESLMLLSISISKICIDWDFLLKTKLNGSPMCCVCHYCSFLNCLQKLNLQDCYYQIYLFKKRKLM